MSRNIDNISSIFRVSGHPDTIFTNESRFLGKSEKIAQYWRYIVDISVIYLYIRHKSDTKCRLRKKLEKNTNWPIYRHISASVLNYFFCFFFYPTARNC